MSGLVRIKGWEQRLSATKIGAMRRVWGWGSFDCCIFAADCILAVTGEDFASDYRGAYETEAEAYRLLASLGHRDLASLVSARLPERPYAYARRGDIALMPGEFGDFVAVCDGITAVAPAEGRGLRHAPIEGALRFWGVG